MDWSNASSSPPTLDSQWRLSEYEIQSMCYSVLVNVLTINGGISNLVIVLLVICQSEHVARSL